MPLKSMVQRKRENSMFNMNSNFFKMMITLSIFGLVLAGCNGGGSGSSADTGTSATSAKVVEGVLVDSPVAGVNYQTETHEGITDADGHFVSYEGEMVQFMIGDVVLGQAVAGDVITLTDFLGDNATPNDITNPMVVNMGRFLQSLDADGDPENGITITEAMRNEISGRMIDFHQGVEDFANDPDVIACFDTLNGLNMPHNGMTWNLVSSEDALAHMAEYMDAHMGFGTANGNNGTGNSSMGGNMNSQMGYTNENDDGTPDTANGYMGEQMNDYMDDHMGYTDENDNGTPDTANGYMMDDQMIDYMNDYMGYTDDEASDNGDTSGSSDSGSLPSMMGSYTTGGTGTTGATMGMGMGR